MSIIFTAEIIMISAWIIVNKFAVHIGKSGNIHSIWVIDKISSVTKTPLTELISMYMNGGSIICLVSASQLYQFKLIVLFGIKRKIDGKNLSDDRNKNL